MDKQIFLSKLFWLGIALIACIFWADAVAFVQQYTKLALGLLGGSIILLRYLTRRGVYLS